MSSQRRFPTLSAAAVLSAALFVSDVLTPLGVAAGYAAVVLVSLWSPGRWDTLLTAAVVTALAALGLAISLSPGSGWIDVHNRALTVLLIWVTAALGLATRRTAKLTEANARLRQEALERRRAEERVREQAALLDQVPDAILVRDMEDRVQYWSRGAEQLYGWTAAEALGRNANALLYRADAPEPLQATEAVLAAGAWSGEVRQVAKDGQPVVAAARWVLLRDGRGRPKAKLVVNTDVRARKSLEAQLRRAQRLESLGTLAGGVAHDFNNLLTPILMVTELLKQPLDETKRLRLLGMIQSGAERGAELVRQLLAFAGGGEGPAGVVRPADVIAEVRNILDHTLPRSIEMRTAVAEALCPVRGDATQLAQVLMNLCINARDAMPDGGAVSIAATNVTRDGRREPGPQLRAGRYVLLTVADTGPGFAPEVLDRAFDLFFTTKPPGKGTGLGLSTAMGIVKAHGGWIDIRSQVGRGARVEVYLPALTDEEAAAREAPRPPAPGGNRELVLVVDDEPAIREAATAALEAHGYRVLTAGGGAEAIQAYREAWGEVRAVLLDMMMPGMDGPATAAALRQIDPHVRVVATSGLRGGDRSSGPLVAGRVSFLPKPYTNGQLLAALASALRAD